MKKAAVLLCALFILCLFCGVVPTEQQALAEDLTPNSQVCLFEEDLFAYTDGDTFILHTDGTGMSKTTYPADTVLRRGSYIHAVSFAGDLVVIERFDAVTLTAEDLFALPFAAKELRLWEHDAFGCTYAVLQGDSSALQVCDSAGSLAGNLRFASPIRGIQVLENTLYVFLDTETHSITLNGTVPAESALCFSHTNHAPYRMLTAEIYMDEEGVLHTTDAELLNTGHAALNENDLAAGEGYIYWKHSNNTVGRCTQEGGSAEETVLPGTVEAVSSAAAVVRTDGRYILVPYGAFVSLQPTPSPMPTAPPPAAPDPMAGELTLEDGCLYAPAGLTASRLKKILPGADILKEDGTTAAGKLRTGWSASVNGTVYTVVIPGDVNGSGTVNSMDLRFLQRILLELDEPDGARIRAADLNKNGRPDTGDLVLLAARLAE